MHSPIRDLARSAKAKFLYCSRNVFRATNPEQAVAEDIAHHETEQPTTDDAHLSLPAMIPRAIDSTTVDSINTVRIASSLSSIC